MEEIKTKPEQQPSFFIILLVPVVCLLIGGLLIYYTETQWQLFEGSFLPPVFWGIILAIATFIGVLLVTRLPISQTLRDVCRQLIPIFDGMNFWQIMLISLLAGIGEELLFRGFLQQWLAGYYPIEIAVGIASIIFGLLHFVTFSYFLLTTLLGAAFGIAYYLTGSLLLIMVWHAFYDLLIIWILTRRPEMVKISPSK